jgi:hypothetical protein
MTGDPASPMFLDSALPIPEPRKSPMDERVPRAWARFEQEFDLPVPSLDLREAFLAGWRAGGADVLRSTARLAELVPTLRELIAWLEQGEEA